MSYQLYGFDMSYFTGKLRAYLRCKGIAFTEKAPNVLEIRSVITKRIGFMMLPILITEQDETLQDTSFIIAELEKRHPEPPMIPVTPCQNIAAHIFELIGDEWMLPPAMHYRWQVGKDNQKRFMAQAGAGLFPWLPGFMGRYLANRNAANAMRAHLPRLDIGPNMKKHWIQWTEQLCDEFDAHFAQHDFLLGGAPCLGDFGLQGPFYAHLGADPWPREHLMRPRPHFLRWVDQTQNATGPFAGQWLAGDAVPQTLDPIIRRFAEEFVPYLRQGCAAAKTWAAQNDISQRWVPRSFGVVDYRINGVASRREAVSSSVWKAQRLQNIIDALTADEQTAVETWLQGIGITLPDLRLPQRPIFTRRNFRTYIAAEV